MFLFYILNQDSNSMIYKFFKSQKSHQTFKDLFTIITTVIDSSANKSTYTGLTRNTFKKRWYKHNSDFNNEENKHSTTLSTCIWDLKSSGQDYQISWKVIDRGAEFNPATRKCRLCLKEKYHILFNSACASLNSRSEMFATCRHRKRLLLENT